MILVAGGTGLLGSRVANGLRARGHPVRVLSRGLAPRPGVLDPGVEVVRADVRDPGSLVPAMEGVDVAVSCVQGFAGPGGVSPQSVDLRGNVNLVDAAETVGADFVLTSVAGSASDSPLELARMKYLAEEHLRTGRLRWTIIRPDAYAQVWVALVASTIAGGRPLVFGNADNPVAWVDVGEVAALVQRAVEDPGLRGDTFDICGPEPLTVMELAQAYMKAKGLPGRPRRVPRPVLHVLASTAGRLRPELGRQVRAALAMDVLPPAEDRETRARFPDLPRRPVTDVIAELVPATL
jgi:NADH dehydrogenase